MVEHSRRHGPRQPEHRRAKLCMHRRPGSSWAPGTQKEAEIVASYFRTRSSRFLVSLRKITQDAMRGVHH